MKNIKYFKYKDTFEFQCFVLASDYKLEDVKGFSYIGQKQYHGNVLKLYYIHFNDGEKECFKQACFKDFNEYRQSILGFNGCKLFY